LGKHPRSAPPAGASASRRAPSPRSSASIANRSKTPSAGGESGFDAGKKVKGRKRHIWVDSLGLLLAVSVTTADVSAARAACDLLYRRSWEEFARLEVVNADNSYRPATCTRKCSRGRRFACTSSAGPRTPKAFVLLPQRWVVERTSPGWAARDAWLRYCEHRPESSEAMIEISMIHMMLGRLAPSKKVDSTVPLCRLMIFRTGSEYLRRSRDGERETAQWSLCCSIGRLLLRFPRLWSSWPRTPPDLVFPMIVRFTSWFRWRPWYEFSRQGFDSRCAQ